MIARWIRSLFWACAVVLIIGSSPGTTVFCTGACAPARTDGVTGFPPADHWPTEAEAVRFDLQGLVGGSGATPERVRNAAKAAFAEVNRINRAAGVYVRYEPWISDGVYHGVEPNIRFTVPDVPVVNGEGYQVPAQMTEAADAMGNTFRAEVQIDLNNNGRPPESSCRWTLSGYHNENGTQTADVVVNPNPTGCRWWEPNSANFDQGLARAIIHEIFHMEGVDDTQTEANGDYLPNASTMNGFFAPNDCIRPTSDIPIPGVPRTFLSHNICQSLGVYKDLRADGSNGDATVSICDIQGIVNVYSLKLPGPVHHPGGDYSGIPGPGQGLPPGSGSGGTPYCAADGDGDGWRECDGDCDDSDSRVHPYPDMETMCDYYEFYVASGQIAPWEDVNLDCHSGFGGDKDECYITGARLLHYESMQPGTFSGNPCDIGQCDMIITGSAPSGPAYLGCFTDDENRALPVLLGTGHTVESCIQTAADNGYSFAGLQYYGYCFAGNGAGYAQVSDGECNTPCDANPSEMCGGGWRNSIYTTGVGGGAPPVPPTSAVLAGETYLYRDETRTSANGVYTLIYQPDGNLVLYHQNGTAVWASSTFGNPGVVRMRADGGLIIYDGTGTGVFDSGPRGNFDPNNLCYMVVGDDGILRIYSPYDGVIWSSSGGGGTGGGGPNFGQMEPDSVVSCNDYSVGSPYYRPDGDACIAWCSNEGGDACVWEASNGNCYVVNGWNCSTEGDHPGFGGFVVH